ncbi:outer membrane lipoprotein carrier protein LolA [Leadbetterella byssophila DSM 17132]|uniref:Outer membrane lipoprotein carrier protein LolA n=1 Tax=Leadbetterella byssophila (strain DSM 17132 / JCM 16389 / KACC 11308 / NBRC 106382 / 4M15) TaxID=649349 RepID=E4RRF3_LEAB4|nr:outer membrane lipoprotein carrier protein LolA [Leadbetterella byssophila]ADQ18486.1 outer membrane lipoprotein carrier protein LolA [Leadbetterella byssophila DSM 17132]
MKKLWFFLLWICFPAIGQKANTILDAAYKKYSGLTSYTAQFKVSDGGSGTLQSKGKKFKLTYGEQIVFNNGKDVYTYFPELNEVNITSYDPADESDVSPNNIFSLYKKGYTATYKKEGLVNGKKVDVISLTPNSKSNIQRIDLNIGKADQMIHSWTVVEKGGSSTFTITKFTANPSLPDATFQFDKSKYPKVEVVDLR